MRRYELCVFDLDGVLYRGNSAISGAPDALRALRGHGSTVRFMTNNSTLTRKAFADKLNEMGFEARPAEIYTSAAGAAIALAGASVFVVGEEGLREELREMGCRIVRDEASDWVVVGACWGLTYAMIDEAQWRVRQGDRFMATNLDPTYPIEDGRVKPGAGAVVAAIATASEKDPEITIGKPEPTLVRMIWAETEISPDETLVVGDRLDTDIECAARAGCDSALVLTGVISKADLKSAKQQPTYICADVGEIE
ncbi:MAG: HAD-IIA family hydrolase [Armatimonadetes bacterium]|nr:HAD-IIA family hydrolase [Armatimonadota bacterium]